MLTPLTTSQLADYWPLIQAELVRMPRGLNTPQAIANTKLAALEGRLQAWTAYDEEQLWFYALTTISLDGVIGEQFMELCYLVSGVPEEQVPAKIWQEAALIWKRYVRNLGLNRIVAYVEPSPAMLELIKSTGGELGPMRAEWQV